MKIGINQPNFLPWIGYFDLLDSVDQFIFLDDVEFSKRSFIHRNRLLNKHSEKQQWFSVSLIKSADKELIKNKKINWSVCYKKHLNIIQDWYHDAPFFLPVFDLIKKAYSSGALSLAELNIKLISSFLLYLNISVRLSRSSMYPVCRDFKGSKHTIELVKACDGTEYYNFYNGIASGYHNAEQFSQEKILLFQQNFQHPDYIGRKGKIAPHYLSIIDLIMWNGPNSIEIIRSGRSWKSVT